MAKRKPSLRWDLTPLIKNDNKKLFESQERKLIKESKKFINKWKSKSEYLNSPSVLKTALDEYNDWMTNWANGGNLGYYYSLKHSLDQNNPRIKAKLNKTEELANKIQNDIQFFELSVAKIPVDKQRKFLTHKPLFSYKHFLERLFDIEKYLLSDPEEKIMNLKSTTSYSNWVRMTSSFLSKEERKVLSENGKKETKNFSEVLSLMNNQNKKVRGSAAEAFNDMLKVNLDVAENEINSILYDKKVNDELRGYSRPDQARHVADDIDSKAVDSLVDSVTKRFDISKRHYKLKAQLFRVKKLKYHERNVEYGQIDKKYNFQQCTELINDVFASLDSEFSQIFITLINNGNVDVYPKKGKKSGAFCSYDLISQPTYILLNYNNRLDDVRTLAHEMGHAINDELMKKKQNAINFSTPTSTAEVASTFMEDFVLQKLIKDANDETRLSLMVSKLDQDVSSIFRQIAFYNFENELHEEFGKKGYLSKEEIGRIFQKHMRAYMGNSVEQSEGSQNWWTYVQHFRYFFYVYSYASGLLISKSLQNSVKDNPNFVLKVKEFLSAGSSDSPKNIFMNMGINISDNKFWNKGLNEVGELLESTEKLARNLKKI